MSDETFTVATEQLRHELAADLARGGYVFRDGERYFDKHLVLCRPGLLSRAAHLLGQTVPAEAERIGVHGLGCALLGALIAQEFGIPLVLGDIRDDGEISVRGEWYSGMRVTLVEDVVHTGSRAIAGARTLRRLGAEVTTVVCLLDREAGAAQRLAEEGISVRALFAEQQVLGTTAVIP